MARNQMMFRTLPLVLFATSATAQEGEQDLVGTLTATIGAEDRNFVVVTPGQGPSSGFERWSRAPRYSR